MQTLPLVQQYQHPEESLLAERMEWGGMDANNFVDNRLYDLTHLFELLPDSNIEDGGGQLTESLRVLGNQNLELVKLKECVVYPTCELVELSIMAAYAQMNKIPENSIKETSQKAIENLSNPELFDLIQKGKMPEEMYTHIKEIGFNYSPVKRDIYCIIRKRPVKSVCY